MLHTLWAGNCQLFKMWSIHCSGAGQQTFERVFTSGAQNPKFWKGGRGLYAANVVGQR